MSRAFRVQVRVIYALVLLLLAGTPVGRAASRDEDLFIRPSDQHIVLFGSVDGGRSTFVSGGGKQTLTGPLDRPGFVLMETAGYGLTRERLRSEAVSLPVRRFVHQASVLAGHQWSLGPVFLSALIGPETHTEQLTVSGRIYRLARPIVGVRGQVELWAHPTRDTLVTGTIVTGSTRSSAWARGSFGVRLFGSTFIGPEVTAYATPTYSETRIGGHLTGVSAGLVTFRISGGWMTDDGHRRGSAYAGVTAWIRL